METLVFLIEVGTGILGPEGANVEANVGSKVRVSTRFWCKNPRTLELWR